MTSISPDTVWYEIEAELFQPDPGPGYTQISVVSVTPSMDMDRVPFCAGELVLTGVDDATWAALDSRVSSEPPRLFFRVFQKAHNDDGDEVTVMTLPYIDDGTGNQTGELVVRRATRDWITGDVTVTVAGQESLMDDKRRIAPTTVNTGATSVYGLVEWSLLDVFGSISIVSDSILGSTALPAGDRRLMLQGETHSELLEAELSAIGCRIYDLWGRTWYAVARETPPTYTDAPTLVKLATYTQAEGAPADADPIIHELTETVTRDGDWADGVLVKGQYTDGSGDRQEWAQASGLGVNTRGRVIEVDRAEPGTNLADEIVTRTLIRGHEINVTARIRFDVLPGMDLECHTRHGVITGSIRAVEWDIAEGTMTIRAESGEPIE